MKKVLIIIICLIMIVGCKNNKNESDNKTTTTTTITNTTKYVEPAVFTKMDINRKLYDFGIEIYKNNSYTRYSKVNGKYFISLNDMVKDFKFDDSKMIGATSKKVCDHEKTGIYFDIDNVEKVEYKEYPILIAVYCD